MPNKTLYLFRQDLRLKDNAALLAAIRTNQPVLLLFIFDDENQERYLGSASRWWLHHSLQALSDEIAKRRGKLILKKGDTLTILTKIIQQNQVNKLYFSRTYEPNQRRIEEAINKKFQAQIEVKRFGGYLLFEPEQIKTKNGKAYKVFTPFWQTCLKQTMAIVKKSCDSGSLQMSLSEIESNALNDWHLLPTKPNWAESFQDYWQPGEAGAELALTQFLHNGLNDYSNGRDRPDQSSTSKLSPHLHFGEITPSRVWFEINKNSSQDKILAPHQTSFLRELGWRDFANHLLFHCPNLPTQSFRKEYDAFPWQTNNVALSAWQTGQTGYPIVDAGMRQLWHSGWMHNRVRMITASFLLKHLLLDWRIGEAWFWDTLLDADLANNVSGWQWVAGAGADAAPYFRIFNPILQGKKFDPNGDYVKRWVPELTKLKTQYLHAPWQAPTSELAKINLRLSFDYPLPIVDHTLSRQRALATYKQFRELTSSQNI